MRLGAVLLCACLIAHPTAQTPQPDGLSRLVAAIEYAVRTGDVDALHALARPNVVSHARLSDFVLTMTTPKATEVTIKERDRAPLEGGGQRLLLEILTVHDTEGRA